MRAINFKRSNYSMVSDLVQYIIFATNYVYARYMHLHMYMYLYMIKCSGANGNLKLYNEN